LQQEKEKNKSLQLEVDSLNNTIKLSVANINEELRLPMLNIVSSILKVYGTKSYLNGVELPIEIESDNDTSDFEVNIHYANSAKISNNFKQGLIRASKDKDYNGNYNFNKKYFLY